MAADAHPRHPVLFRATQRAWLPVEQPPTHAPRVNPTEQLRGTVNTRELADVSAPDLAKRRPPLRAGAARLRRQPRLTLALVRHAGLAF